MPHKSSLQETIIQNILKLYGKKSQAVDALKDILSKEKDAIYRKINGQASLSVEELEHLVQHYGFSVDNLLNKNGDKIIFSFDGYEKPVHDFKDWVDRIYDKVNNLSQLPEVSGTYVALGLPFYLYFSYPKLIAFRLYVFGISSWNLPFLKDRPFSFDLISPEVAKKAQSVAKIYNSVPSREIWNFSMIDNSQLPLEFMLDAGKFADPKDALEICDEMLKLLEHGRQMAEKGKKFLPEEDPNQLGLEDFDLFYNELPNTQEFIIVKSALRKFIFTTFRSPELIWSAEEQLVPLVEDWLAGVLNHATYISKHTSRNRNVYFSRLKEQVMASRDRIERKIST